VILDVERNGIRHFYMGGNEQTKPGLSSYSFRRMDAIPPHRRPQPTSVAYRVTSVRSDHPSMGKIHGQYLSSNR